MPFTSWAEAPGEELRSTGFSRVGGFATEVVSVGASESHSDVRYIGRGKLQSNGSSAIKDINLLEGQIRIKYSNVAATIVSGTSGEPMRHAECTFGGLSIGGQPVEVNDLSNEGVQGLLDQVAAATGYEVKIIPPSPVVLEEREAGKQVASCTGVKVFITDLHQGSPVPACAPPIDPSIPECVPAAGNRVELTFGNINVQQSVNDFESPLDDLGGGLVGDVGDVGDIDAPPTSDVSGDATTIDVPSGDVPEQALTPPPTSSGDQSAAPAPASPSDVAIQGDLASSSGERNLGAIGALTAAATPALMAGVLLLIGVINALGSGGRFRMPGFGR
jgi:hypothetical protein